MTGNHPYIDPPTPHVVDFAPMSADLQDAPETGLNGTALPDLPGVDLSGISPDGIDLVELPGVDLSGIDLTGIALPDMHMSGVDLPGFDPNGNDRPDMEIPEIDLPGSGPDGIGGPYVGDSGLDRGEVGLGCGDQDPPAAAGPDLRVGDSQDPPIVPQPGNSGHPPVVSGRDVHSYDPPTFSRPGASEPYRTPPGPASGAKLIFAADIGISKSTPQATSSEPKHPDVSVDWAPGTQTGWVYVNDIPGVAVSGSSVEPSTATQAADGHQTLVVRVPPGGGRP